MSFALAALAVATASTAQRTASAGCGKTYYQAVAALSVVAAKARPIVTLNAVDSRPRSKGCRKM